LVSFMASDHLPGLANLSLPATRRNRSRDRVPRAVPSDVGLGRSIRSPKERAVASQQAKSKNPDKPKAAEPARRSQAADDDTVVTALGLEEAAPTDAMAAYFKKCEEKLGFVPNVLRAYAFDMPKLEAFVAMYNDLMLAPSGLSKLEREMIAVAVSSVNR